MHFAIGTTNIPKSAAIEYVLTSSPYTSGATWSNHKVSSWVPDMPTTLEELRTGAKNRAKNCRELIARNKISQKQEIQGRKIFSKGVYETINDWEANFSNEEVRNFSEIIDADYFVGMEWWVYRDSEGENYWYVGVVYIEDSEGRWYWWYSSHLHVPPRVVELLFDGRRLDLEQVMQELTGEENIWDKQGSGYVWSDGQITRTEKFAHATLCALVPHFSKFYS